MANNYIARDSLLEKLQTTSIVTDDLYGMGIMIVRPDDSCEFGERRATTHV